MKQLTMVALGVGAYLLWKKKQSPVTAVLPPMAETDKIPLDYYDNRGQAESEVEARLHAGQGSKSDYVIEPVTIHDKVFWHIIYQSDTGAIQAAITNKYNLVPASVESLESKPTYYEESNSLTRTYKDENGNLMTVY